MCGFQNIDIIGIPVSMSAYNIQLDLCCNDNNSVVSQCGTARTEALR